MDVVARAAAFDHVAGKSEGRAAESDDGNASAEMLRDQRDRLGNIAQFGGAVGAQVGDVFFACEPAFR